MTARTQSSVSELRETKSRIRSVDDLGPYVKVLIYGPNGSGKTRFAASAPKCLIIDINEDGTRSAVGSGSDVFEVNSWQDIGQIYWLLKSGKHRYESVAIDTITMMQNLAMSFVLDEKEERDPSSEGRMPDKRSYGRSGELVKGMLLAFRNLDMNVIFLAQSRDVKDQDTGEVIEHAVDLPAGSRATATACVSVLGFMQQKEVRVSVKGKRKKVRMDTLRLSPSDEFISLKDRTNNLGEELRRPTMPKVIKAWATKTSNDEEEED